MVVEVADFKAVHPEFANTPDALVQEKLEQAEIRTPENIWGEKQRMGILYLTGHLLLSHPHAYELRKQCGGDSCDNNYLRERKRLVRVVASGFRVVGE